jgi:hypothetical protein
MASMMNNHLQALKWRTPFMPPVIAAAKRPLNAPESREPE